jgi:hypothetical protein
MSTELNTPHKCSSSPHRFLVPDTQIHTQRQREKQADIVHFPDLIFVDLYSYPMYATTPHNFQLPQQQQDFFPRKNSASMKQINHHTLTHSFPLPSHHQIKQTNKTK